MSGKNSADIRMVVDALDLCYSKEHIDIFALLSGDSDFSPLVSKLKENDKRVIGCGVKSSTSDLLIASCDEFIYYDDLSAPPKQKPAEARPRTKTSRQERRQAGRGRRARDGDRAARSSRTTTRCGARSSSRRSAASTPASTKSYYGYRTFSDLLEDAEQKA